MKRISGPSLSSPSKLLCSGLKTAAYIFYFIYLFPVKRHEMNSHNLLCAPFNSAAGTQHVYFDAVSNCFNSHFI